jgi:hypothetical protein
VFNADPQSGVQLRGLSLQGIISGVQQNLYHVSIQLGGFSRRSGVVNFEIAPPEVRVVAPVALGVCLAAMALAWTRIRAVEVVQG